MSQIDQAFIQAYSPDSPPVMPFEKPLPASASQVKLYTHVATTDDPQGYQVALDAVPAPHFPTESPSSAVIKEEAIQEDPYSQTAAIQRATLHQEAPAPPRSPAAPAGERRPLSSFAIPQTPPPQAFRPVFEVDGFRWPAITTELLGTHVQTLAPVAEQLLVASEEGRSMVGIAGARSGVGATTIHLCLARLLASAGKSVAMVDADFVNRSLLRNLGLEFDVGWENVLAGQTPLAESVVHSLGDKVSLLPLVGHSTPATDLLSSIQTSVSAGVLRYHYDLVLFDLGAAGQEPQWSTAQEIVEHCRIDASIIVADSQHTESAALVHVDQLMSLLGSTCLGMIGNNASL
ncbi:MAG: hypothetical protein MI725_05525 [Pirellulales bacterium]|nr:hypothetical protein [Pirellulales bacterium]